MLDILENDLKACFRVLPGSVHEMIRRTNIWLNVDYVYGDVHTPTVVKHSTAHHFDTWLV